MGAGSTEPPSLKRPRSENEANEAATRLRHVSSDVIPPHAAPPPPFKRVKICGEAYTTLQRFNGGAQTGPRKRNMVRNKRGQDAMLLDGGDHKSLEASGYATARGRELLPKMKIWAPLRR